MSKATPGVDDLATLREKMHGLGTLWLFTLTAALVAVALPWFLRALEVHLAPVAWSLFAGALACWLAGTLAKRWSRRGLLIAMTLQQALGILLLVFVWHLGGGLANPVFLVIFALPVAAGSWLLSGWARRIPALLAVVSPAALAFMESSDLRWFSLQVGLPVERLAELLPELHPAAAPFPSLAPSPSYQFTLIATFTVLIAALAWFSGHLVAAAARLEQQHAGQRSPEGMNET